MQKADFEGRVVYLRVVEFLKPIIGYGVMKISLIGAGNVAWHLGLALENAGHSIVEVFSRDMKKAKYLTSFLYNAKAQIELDFSESDADLFILSVSDSAIPEVCSKLVLPENAILAHTSGTKSLNDLVELMELNHDLPVECAVFYPLMTFTMGVRLDIQTVPFCIESYNTEVREMLVKLGQQMSKTVYLVSSEERIVLHIGAVFACNFTNHLIGLSKYILDRENLDYDLLKPIIRETIRKALGVEHPAKVQTGPAVRGDTSTIKRHLGYLSADNDLYKVYETLTLSIQEWHEE